MPRRRRVLLSGNPLHIVQRGINREPCFFAEEDCHCYLHWLEESARACRCAIHAYPLMTPKESGAPSRLMQSLGRRYVQYANRFYRRTGLHQRVQRRFADGKAKRAAEAALFSS